jgi:hypothetical protein
MDIPKAKQAFKEKKSVQTYTSNSLNSDTQIQQAKNEDLSLMLAEVNSIDKGNTCDQSDPCKQREKGNQVEHLAYHKNNQVAFVPNTEQVNISNMAFPKFVGTEAFALNQKGKTYPYIPEQPKSVNIPADRATTDNNKVLKDKVRKEFKKVRQPCLDLSNRARLQTSQQQAKSDTIIKNKALEQKSVVSTIHDASKTDTNKLSVTKWGQHLPNRAPYLAPIQESYLHIPHVNLSIYPSTTPLCITSKEGHQITFIQDAGYWWSILKANCPLGFSRTLKLPVYYLDRSYIPHKRSHLVPHTVETLLKAPAAIQKHATHVVLPEKDPQRKGFLHIGSGMGLLGGGEDTWKTVGKTAVAVSVVFIPKVVIVAIAVVKFVSWLFGCISDFLEARIRAIRRQKVIDQVNEFLNSINSETYVLFKNAKELFASVCATEESYQKLHEYLAQFERYKNQIKEIINKLEGFKINSYLLPEDKKYIDSAIGGQKSDLRRLESMEEKVKKLCRHQAWSAFEKDTALGSIQLSTYSNRLDEAFGGISTTEGLYNADNNLSHCKKQLRKNKKKYNKWKEEPALFDEDRETIEGYILGMEDTLSRLKLREELIDEARKGTKNAASIQNIVNAKTEKEQGLHARGAIDRNDLSVLSYLIEGKRLSPNITDYAGNTLLHRAIITNNPKIVEYLLKKETTTKIKTRGKNGKTPLELAKEKGYTSIINLLEKNTQ